MQMKKKREKKDAITKYVVFIDILKETKYVGLRSLSIIVTLCS